MFCGKGRKERRKKKKKKGTETWPSAVWTAVPRTAPSLPGTRTAGLRGEKAPPRVRGPGRYPCFARRPPRPNSEVAQAQRGPRRRRPGEPVPCLAPPKAPRPRSRCVHAPGRDRVRVALKERRQVSGGEGPLAEDPCARLLRARAPVRGGCRAGSSTGWGVPKAGLRGVSEEAKRGRPA